MLGTRFLSVFLKVNPYFTVAIAVGFSGIAAIGVNHTETFSLRKLIPLHIKSVFTDVPPAHIVSEVPGLESAGQLIHALAQGYGPKDGLGNHSGSPVRPFLSPSPKPWHRQDADLAGPNDLAALKPLDTAANEPGPDADEPSAVGPYGTTSMPSDAASIPSVPFTHWTMSPPIYPISDRPSPVLPSIVPSPLIAGSDAPPEWQSFPVDIPPVLPIIEDPGVPVVDAAEPPVGFLFVGVVVALIGLRRRARHFVKTAIAP